LPFDDFIDLNDDLTISDLERLDRQAAKTEKNLEKLKRKGGIFAGETSGTTTGNKAAVNFAGTEPLSKQDKRFEKQFKRLEKKINKDIVKNIGKKDGIFSNVIGDSPLQNIFSFGKNPVSFMTNIAKAIPFLGGVFAAKEIAEFIIDEIVKIDRFFKKFVDVIDTRRDQLRNKQQQAEIAAGLTQVIITTESGNVEARDAYNTFNEFNNNRTKLEEDFAIRNTTGYE